MGNVVRAEVAVYPMMVIKRQRMIVMEVSPFQVHKSVHSDTSGDDQVG